MSLVVTTGQPRPSNWMSREAEPVLPSGAAAAVRVAVRADWTPTAPGSAFHLDQSAGFTPSPSTRLGIRVLVPQPTTVSHDGGFADRSGARVPRCTPPASATLLTVSQRSRGGRCVCTPPEPSAWEV